jgi:Ni2+-binding GTPase involved in maturation of urease and hydrogenase
MQPFPGADIWDIIYYTDAGIVKVNYDIIIIHVGTNNVCNHKLADFSYAYNVLITTVKRLSNLNIVIILSAIIPRPLDNSANVVKSVNFQLQSICHKRAVKFVTTYKPFLKVWGSSL